MAKSDDDDNLRLQWKKLMGARLAKELQRLGLTQADISRSLNVTKQLSNHWVTGRSEITSWQLLLLDRLGIDIPYILLNQRAGSGGLRPVLPYGIVPHPTHAELLELVSGKLDPSSIRRARPVYKTITNGLAVSVEDAGMSPRLPVGSVVVVDRNKQPQEGEIVVVALQETAEVLVRRYFAGARRGAPMFVLRADNALLPERPVLQAHRPVLIGVTVEASVMGSR